MKTITLKIMIIITIVFIMFSNCYKTYTVENRISKESLENALEKFVDSQENNQNYDIKLISNDLIEITTSDGSKYNLNFDLQNEENIIFKLEMFVKNGMSYNDFKSQTDNLMLPMLGYLAIAHINNIEYSDSIAYFSDIHMNSNWNGNFYSNSPYSIIDDSGNTILSGGSKNIKVSEFSNKVMEYVNLTYKNQESINDNDNINSFIWTIEKEEVANANDTCKLISTLKVNLNSEFQKIKNYANSINTNTHNEIANSNINSNINNNIENNTQNHDNTTKDGTLPAVGNGKLIGIVIGMSILILLIAIIRSSKFRE